MTDDAELERIKSSAGWRHLENIHRGSGAADRLIEFFKEFPGMLGYEADFAYGDIWMRPGLDLRARSLVTITAIASSGTTPQQLETHINAALNCGCTREEIKEVMIHLVLYLGFPKAMAGMAVAQKAFAARDERNQVP